jgi:hypothetical protein
VIRLNYSEQVGDEKVATELLRQALTSALVLEARCEASRRLDSVKWEASGELVAIGNRDRQLNDQIFRRFRQKNRPFYTDEKGTVVNEATTKGPKAKRQTERVQHDRVRV